MPLSAQLELSALEASTQVEEGGPRLLRMAVLRAQLQRLALKGMDATSAARLLKVDPSTVRRHYADPAFRRMVLGKLETAFEGVDESFKAKRAGLHELLEEQAYKSFESLQTMLEDPELAKGYQIKIHQDFLDRHQDTAPVTRARHSVDSDDLVRAAKVAREMDELREKEGKVVDISYRAG